MSTTGCYDLPKRRSGRLVSWLDRTPLRLILIFALGTYSVVPIAFSLVEWALASRGSTLVKGVDGSAVHNIWSLLYFNFTTILTIGYGDYTPVSVGRLMSLVEAVVGLLFFGIIVAIAEIKAVLPPRDAIVFSRYGYYCTDQQRFLIIFVNTTSSILINPEMCSYYRQGDEFAIGPSYRAPFIGHSVWTFFLNELPEKTLIAGPERDSALRFGITGRLGLSIMSAYVEYEPANIRVIRNRAELVAYPGFRNANLADEGVRRMFHYDPGDSESLAAFVARKKRDAGG